VAIYATTLMNCGSWGAALGGRRELEGRRVQHPVEGWAQGQGIGRGGGFEHQQWEGTQHPRRVVDLLWPSAQHGDVPSCPACQDRVRCSSSCGASERGNGSWLIGATVHQSRWAEAVSSKLASIRGSCVPRTSSGTFTVPRECRHRGLGSRLITTILARRG
jgi:hypothetical protein